MVLMFVSVFVCLCVAFYVSMDPCGLVQIND